MTELAWAHKSPGGKNARMDSLPTLNIIGAGRIGKSLGLLWRDGVVQIQDVQARSQDSAAHAVEVIGAGRPVVSFDELRPAAIHLLSVPDDALPKVVETLVQNVDVSGSTVFHTSGWLASDVLIQAKAAGAFVASIHPIKSFADPALAASSFSGTYCGQEGDSEALSVLSPLFETAGAVLVNLETSKKPLYHTATVITSNYLIALVQLAKSSLEASGVDDETSLKMLIPLIKGTAANVEAMGTVKALTGPIVRGDVSTVASHLNALAQWDPKVEYTYADLASHVVDIAAAAGTDESALNEIRKLIERQ